MCGNTVCSLPWKCCNAMAKAFTAMQCVSCESAAYAAALLSSDPSCFVYFLLLIPWQMVKILVLPTILWQLVSGSYRQLGGPEFIKVFLINLTNGREDLVYDSGDTSWYNLAATNGMGTWVLGATWPIKTSTSFAVHAYTTMWLVYTTIGAHVQAHAGFILTQSWSCIFAYS